MKKLLYIFALIIVITNCKTSKEEGKIKVKDPITEYPEDLKKVFKKHGGIAAWNNAKTISYKLKEEAYTVDLLSRKTLISSDNYSLGFDGKDTWLVKKDSSTFKKDPKFYYNLFFYFYAMPFVLADDGIVYEETTPFVYEDVSYPGIKISYQPKVGISPEDNYFIYYNPETYQMEWLGYTVTYFSKKTSKKVKMIRYNNWHDVDGFLLPKSITWYKKDKTDGILKASKKEVVFSETTVSQEIKPEDFYDKPSK